MNNLNDFDSYAMVGNNVKNPQDVLNRYWGFPSFRPLQEDIINAVLEGNDVLAMLPTGGGKSLCYLSQSLYRVGLVGA